MVPEENTEQRQDIYKINEKPGEDCMTDTLL